MQRLHSIVGVILVAIKEVFGVKYDLLTLQFEETYRLCDAVNILFKCCSKDLGDMEIPGLTEDGDDIGTCIKQGHHICILFYGDALTLCTAKGNEFCVLKFKACCRAKELHILWIRARVAAFDVLNAKIIKCSGDFQLVGYRK